MSRYKRIPIGGIQWGNATRVLKWALNSCRERLLVQWTRVHSKRLPAGTCWVSVAEWTTRTATSAADRVLQAPRRNRLEARCRSRTEIGEDARSRLRCRSRCSLELFANPLQNSVKKYSRSEEWSRNRRYVNITSDYVLKLLNNWERITYCEGSVDVVGSKNSFPAISQCSIMPIELLAYKWK